MFVGPWRALLMPVYGSEKRRQMARSILPSTRRSSAADQAAIRRRHRRHVRQDLAVLAGRSSAAFFDDDGTLRPVRRPRDVPGDLGDRLRWPQREIRSLVYDRRNGDKLNHFIRWAVASTAHVPVEDRASKLAAGLPAGLIGDHAMSHLEAVDEICPPPEHGLWWWRYRSRPARPDPVPELSGRLRRLLVAGGHGDINRLLARIGLPPVAGLHDCEAAAARICRGGPLAWRFGARPAVEEFLSDWEAGAVCLGAGRQRQRPPAVGWVYRNGGEPNYF